MVYTWVYGQSGIGYRTVGQNIQQGIQQARKQDHSPILLPETLTLPSSRSRAVSCDISTPAFNESITHQKRLYSPIPGRTYSVMIIASHFLSSKSVRVLVRVWIFRVASRMIPKDFLQAKAEAIDLIVPLVAVLMSMVQGKQLHFTQKLF